MNLKQARFIIYIYTLFVIIYNLDKYHIDYYIINSLLNVKVLINK